MTPAQREGIERRLEASSTAASSSLDRYSEVQLTRRPAGTAWSAAECVVHLSLTADAAVPLLEAAVADLRVTRSIQPIPEPDGLVGSDAPVVSGATAAVSNENDGAVPATACGAVV